MSDQRTLALNPADPASAGAALLALMAYPAGHEAAKYEAASGRLSRWAKGGATVNVPLTEGIDDHHSGSPLIRMDDFIERLQHRLDSADIAIPFVFAMEGVPQSLPEDLRPLEFRFSVLRNGTSERNLRRRRWSPSLPVLHLAMAFAILAQHSLKGGWPFGPLELVTDPKRITRLVALSEAFRGPVLRRWRRAFRTAGQVKIIIVET